MILDIKIRRVFPYPGFIPKKTDSGGGPLVAKLFTVVKCQPLWRGSKK
jgi:hypothetical protein